MALRESMAYHPECDKYTCRNGMKLRAVYTGKRKSKTGFVSEVTHYECENCDGCPYKQSCTKSEGNRRMQVSNMTFGNCTRRSRKTAPGHSYSKNSPLNSTACMETKQRQAKKQPAAS